MKKKTVLLIGSIAAVGLLAGGTFAAYTITDNANPFGIKISPTEISDNVSGTVTLEWGDNTVAKVESLEMGNFVKSGNLVLKASGTEVDESGSSAALTTYTGTLKLSLTDLTDSTSDYHLIDYLDIYYASGDVGGDPAAIMTELPDGAAAFTFVDGVASKALPGTPTGTTYSIFVGLKDTITASIYAQVLNDKCQLKFDWNKNSEDEDAAEAHTIHLVSTPSGWGSKTYVYAYYNDGTQNGNWPGVEMTAGTGELTYELSNDTALLVFSDENGLQTADFTNVDSAKPYYTISASGEGYVATATATAPEATFDYYLIGEIASIEGVVWLDGDPDDMEAEEEKLVGAAGMTTVSDGQNYAVKYGVELTTADKLNIWVKGSGYYKANGDVTVSANGTYDIYYSLDGNVYTALSN